MASPEDAEGAAPPQPAGWAEVFRHAPIGVLVLGFLLLLVGAGLILGGAVFVISGRARSWPVWIVLLGAGPLAIYVALHFLTGRGWAWLTVVAMLVLLALTAALRAAASPVFPLAPLSEILVSVASLAYLFRPRVRQAFR
jgi:hypothetical protein